MLQYSNHYLLIARGSDDVWRNLDHTSTAEQWSGGKTDPERVLKVWCDPGVPAAAPAEKSPARSPATPAAAAAPAGALQSSGARQLLQCVDAWNEPDEQQSIPQASVQREAARGAAAALDPARIQEAGRLGTSGAGRPLPFLEKIQRAFGRHDLSGVVAHSDSAAAAGARAMGAEAFTTGDHVAFAREPALATAAHEAAHVVQQRAGVQLPGGVGRVGDEHERHADVVAARVVAGQSSEDLLDRYMGGAQPAGQVDAVQAQEGEPELKHYEKKQVYSYTESGAVRWIDAFKIDFLKGSGFDLLLSARKKGYTTFGALFIIAHATLESGWGKGNWADTTHNLFSLMGGSDKKYKTAHGTLAKYADVSQAFDAYLAQLAKADRWPTTVAAGTGLYYQESFTPDDVNKAFRQKDYYAKGGYPYNADPASDYGDVLFDRMRWLAGPLIVLIGQIIAAAPADSENAKLLPGYLTELQAAYSNVAARLAAHRKPAAKASAPVQRAMAPTPEPGAAGSRLPR